MIPTNEIFDSSWSKTSLGWLEKGKKLLYLLYQGKRKENEAILIITKQAIAKPHPVKELETIRLKDNDTKKLVYVGNQLQRETRKEVID